MNRVVASEPTIRPARADDATFVAGLAAELLRSGAPLWTDPAALTGGFAAALSRAVREPGPDRAVYIAQDPRGRPLGFISLRVRPDATGRPRAHVADLAVVPHARRRGAGTALMRTAQAWARERGLGVLSLDVWAANEPALAFYRSLGYTPESLCLVARVAPEA